MLWEPVAKSQDVPHKCVVAPTLVFQRKDPFESMLNLSNVLPGRKLGSVILLFI
jgi:hypothetical protein